MTKYTTASSRRDNLKKAKQTHPIWRGIGCVFTILIPIISFAGGILTVNYGLDQGWPIPYQLLGYPRLPDLLYKSNAIAAILSPVTSWNNLYAILSVAFFYMLILGGLLAFFNALVYRYAGPPRWGPQDVPPPSFRTKRYKR